MFDLLVRIVNRPSRNRKLHVNRFHRGDVVSAKPTGWVWTSRELTNPEWRIFTVDLTQAETDALLAAEPDPLKVKTFRWKRWRSLDIGAVPALQAAADGPRKSRDVVRPDVLPTLRATVVTRIPADTAII